MEKIALEIVNDIIVSICDRSGLENAWEDIDGEIQDEIKTEWINIVLNKLNNQ